MACDFDVLILGAGITGLATAHFLRNRGIDRLLVVDRNPGVPDTTSLAAGYVIGGQVDNITRLSHAHGVSFAADLWRFGDRGFFSLLKYCEENLVSYELGSRMRLVVSEPELVEARKAAEVFDSIGVQHSLKSRRDSEISGLVTDRCLSIQDDGKRGAYVDVGGLLEKLRTGAEIESANVKKLVAGPDGVRLILESGGELRAEIVVLAAHLAAQEFLPQMSDAFVSVVEQWIECEFEADDFPAPGCVFSANHALEHVVVLPEKRLRMLGGRYLRNRGGVGVSDAVVEEKITDHLVELLEKTFENFKIKKVTKIRAGLDLRPCDELPLIGPIFGEDRLLISSGFMGSGLSQGFYSGYTLAQLIADGRCESLPQGLHPSRLRSLKRDS